MSQSTVVKTVGGVTTKVTTRTVTTQQQQIHQQQQYTKQNVTTKPPPKTEIVKDNQTMVKREIRFQEYNFNSLLILYNFVRKLALISQIKNNKISKTIYLLQK